ncbi:MAG: TetR/AcrR family transcriptional regulator [Phycisphaerales bacterium]
MASSDRRAREKAITRTKILGAARSLFIAHGYESVSMRKIAEAIEYTAAAIYSHFPDKQSLMIALCDEDFGALREAMRHVELIEDPVERLHAMGRAYVDFAFEHPHHYRFMFMTTHPEDPELIAECELKHGNPDQDGYAFLERVVEECISTGRVAKAYRDPAMLTQLFWGASHGVVSLFITHGKDPWVNFTKPRETAYLLLEAALDGACEPRKAAPKPVRRKRP